MARYTRNSVGTVQGVNAELTKVQQAINDTLSRKGDVPNQMEATLDMNSERIINLPAPISDHEPFRKGDLPIIEATLQPIADAAQESANVAQEHADAALASELEATNQANRASNEANRASNEADRAESIATSTGWFVVGDFADGVTFTARNQVARDSSGEFWSYNGSLPFTVPAGTVPSEPTYTNRGDAALRSALAAADSDVLVGGVAAGDLGRKYGEFVSALDFMWVSDSDFGLVLNLALSSSNTVYVPDGNYIVATPITANNDNVSLILSSNAVINYTVPTLNLITFNGVNSKIIGGVILAPDIFDGANVRPTYGVVNFTKDQGLVERVKIVNVPKIGVFFKNCNNGKVINCYIDGGTENSFYDGVNTVHSAIYCDPSGAGSQGNFIISNNIIKNVVQGGLSGNLDAHSFEHSVVVTGNVFENCWDHGWYTPGLGNGHNISGNAFNRCKVPIAVTGRNHVIANNTLVVQTIGTGAQNDVENTGISLRNPKACIVQGNTIKGSGPTGGVCIDLQYNSGVPGDPDVIDNIVANNSIEINNVDSGGVAAIRVTSSNSVIARNKISNNIIKAPIRLNSGLIEITANSTFEVDCVDNEIANNTLLITQAWGNGYAVFVNSVADCELAGNSIRLGYNSDVARVLWMILLSNSARIRVLDNTLKLSSAHGDNIDLRLFAESGVCASNEIANNRDSVDATKLIALSRYALLPTSGTVINQKGVGAPEGSVISGVGGIWRRDDGGAGTTLYVKESGTSNTGWVAK